MPDGSSDQKPPLAEDVLEGAAEIAAFLWPGKANPKKVYRAVELKQLPVYTIGNRIHARRSTLLRYIQEQEDGSLRKPGRAS